jgi:arsenite methyltransferase
VANVNETPEQISAAVKQRFASLACSPESEKKFPIGPESARRLGYAAKEIDALPKVVTESFAGVGNPFSLGKVLGGQSVLDLGCGAGLDSILAARMAGPKGKVFAIDMTPEMIEKARDNAKLAGTDNIEFFCADIGNLPLSSDSVDVAISNGVFNLCVDKPKVLAETFRVLKRGGRLQMADILLEAGAAQTDGTWSD